MFREYTTSLTHRAETFPEQLIKASHRCVPFLKIVFLSMPCLLPVPSVRIPDMSLSQYIRTMASPFHRPPPFQFPRGPPSPPDTNPDSIFPGMPVPMLSTQPLSGQDFGLHDVGLLNPSPDMPGSRMRKSSSIPYHPTGLRDNKDKASSSQLRSGKPLIIVIPPSNLLQERGQAQIVTNGPYNRLSQGIVMPLFPSVCYVRSLLLHAGLTTSKDVRTVDSYCQRI